MINIASGEVADPLRGSARIPRFDRGLVVQNHVQQGIIDFQFHVVFDKAQFAEFVCSTRASASIMSAVTTLVIEST